MSEWLEIILGIAMIVGTVYVLFNFGIDLFTIYAEREAEISEDDFYKSILEGILLGLKKSLKTAIDNGDDSALELDSLVKEVEARVNNFSIESYVEITNKLAELGLITIKEIGDEFNEE